MIKQTIVTDIRDYDKDKNGNLYKTTDGRNYIRRMIKIEGSDKVLSGFKSKSNEGWKVGDEITINITEKDVNGTTYYNFSDVKMEDRMMEMILSLQRRVADLETKIGKTPEMDESNTPNFDKQLDDLADSEIPF